MSINLSIKLRNCYKTLIQSLTDWSNWSKVGPDTAYFGLLDYCKSSDAESVTVFSWNPVSSDQNYLFWGNTDNGNPSIDWEATESTPMITANRWTFNYCTQLKGTEYDLNQGGKFGDLYCAATPATNWMMWSAAQTATGDITTAATKYDKSVDPNTDPTNICP
jgi:hypothetical protein